MPRAATTTRARKSATAPIVVEAVVETSETPVVVNCVDLIEAGALAVAQQAWDRAVLADSLAPRHNPDRDRQCVKFLTKQTQHVIERLDRAYRQAEERYTQAELDYSMLLLGYQRIGYTAAYLILEHKESLEAYRQAAKRLKQARMFLVNMRNRQKYDHIA